MDSLSQLVLGAATGEAVLGRKLGNRALWLGAVGGTIPDLDVLGGLWLDPLDNLAFHRGITHSVLFMVLLAPLLGLLSRRLLQKTEVGWGAWTFFWFATLATHVLLDCFTLYGTQVFAPFSDLRVSWSTISVADPLYTMPFLLALVGVARSAVGSRARRVWKGVGWGVSCFYLAWTVNHKVQIDSTVNDALSRQGIQAVYVITTPTILNNILWSVAVDAGDVFYVGTTSLLDATPLRLHPVPKQHDMAPARGETWEVLQWFSDGFLAVTAVDGDRVTLADLRFGTFVAPPRVTEDFIFRFAARREGEALQFIAAEGGPPPGKERDFFPSLWRRIWGEQPEV